MEGSRELVTRMLPLPQPELEHSSQASQWLIKTEIAFGTEQRRQSLSDDVDKASDAEDVDGQKKVAAGDQPVCDQRG